MQEVMVVMGTRPEAIKLAPVIKELKKYPNELKLTVVAIAQHRQMLDQVLKLFDITADYDLDIMQEYQKFSEIISRVVRDFDLLVSRKKPDWILVQGDTTTSFICALIGFLQKAKVGHIEAGLRTEDKFNPFPEEMNRRLTSAVVDVHFAPSGHARQNLLSEGVPNDKVFVTGNTVIDALLRISKTDRQFIHTALKDINCANKKEVLVTAHRRENFGKPLENICLALRDIAIQRSEVEIVYPVHLNPNVQSTVYSLLRDVKNVHLIKPLDYLSFFHLMSESYLILTDSGGIQEEALSLGKPVLVLRRVTERSEAVEAGTAKVIGTNREDIVRETLLLLVNSKGEYEKMANAVSSYGDGKSAQKIVKIIMDLRLDENIKKKHTVYPDFLRESKPVGGIIGSTFFRKSF